MKQFCNQDHFVDQNVSIPDICHFFYTDKIFEE